MRQFSQADLDAFQNFMKSMKSQKPIGNKSKFPQKVKTISPQTIQTVKKSRNGIIIFCIIGTIQGSLYLYNKKQKKTWQVETYDINNQVQTVKRWSRFFKLINPFYNVDPKTFFIKQLNQIYTKVSTPPIYFNNQIIYIERKVGYQFYFVQLDVKQKIRQINSKGHLIQTDRTIFITILGIPLFVKQSSKVIKQLKRLVLSKTVPLGIVDFYNELIDLSSKDFTPTAQTIKGTQWANSCQKYMQMNYELNS